MAIDDDIFQQLLATPSNTGSAGGQPPGQQIAPGSMQQPGGGPAPPNPGMHMVPTSNTTGVESIQSLANRREALYRQWNTMNGRAPEIVEMHCQRTASNIARRGEGVRLKLESSIRRLQRAIDNDGPGAADGMPGFGPPFGMGEGIGGFGGYRGGGFGSGFGGRFGWVYGGGFGGSGDDGPWEDDDGF
ncbi:hypothetical protein LTR22_012677 [Elasticomyces elasticus]|nr:hypothetical protein LTR22_012677 [Elasticomyces elasticus]KAK4920083.1 hypothetical protein LTR49_012344 [Elasticomyces elasticus]KAK5757193.1 hypothetical protein LTS12_012709 [Elasticomyces elasticus]